MKFEKEVTTTLTGKQPVKTKLTIVNDDAEKWNQLAIAQAVVRWQNNVVRKGTEVPAEDTFYVSSIGTRGPRDPIARAKSDPAYRRRLMAAIAALEQEGGGEQ